MPGILGRASAPDVLSRPSDMAGATSGFESLDFQFLLTAIPANVETAFGYKLPIRVTLKTLP